MQEGLEKNEKKRDEVVGVLSDDKQEEKEEAVPITATKSDSEQDEYRNLSELPEIREACQNKLPEEVVLEDDPKYEANDDFRGKLQFRTPDGKPLVVGDISEDDSASYRIELLKMYLEQELGFDKFLNAYRKLQNVCEIEDDGGVDEKDLGSEGLKFLPLLHQLLFCEDMCFLSN
eukprot:Platyproteum_vivax@DN12420_c0_g1_i2.p1